MEYSLEIVDNLKIRQDEVSCVEALELAHIQLVNAAVANGWGETQVAEALLELAQLHVSLLRERHRESA